MKDFELHACLPEKFAAELGAVVTLLADVAGLHFHVERRAVDGDAVSGCLDEGVLLSMRRADAMLRDASIRIDDRMHLVTDFVTVLDPHRRANITCGEDALEIGRA